MGTLTFFLRMRYISFFVFYLLLLVQYYSEGRRFDPDEGLDQNELPRNTRPFDVLRPYTNKASSFIDLDEIMGKLKSRVKKKLRESGYKVSDDFDKTPEKEEKKLSNPDDYDYDY